MKIQLFNNFIKKEDFSQYRLVCYSCLAVTYRLLRCNECGRIFCISCIGEFSIEGRTHKLCRECFSKMVHLHKIGLFEEFESIGFKLQKTTYGNKMSTQKPKASSSYTATSIRVTPNIRIDGETITWVDLDRYYTDH